jgi:hypothetical protein
MFNTIRRNVVQALAKPLGFVIIGHGYKKRHYTLSFKEAVSWAACYEGASVYRRGVLVATKLLVKSPQA